MWSQLLAGQSQTSWEELSKEARDPVLKIDQAGLYRLVVAKATNLEQDYGSYGGAWCPLS